MRFLLRVDPVHLRGADVVLAFPGAGLVGGIVVEELVENLDLRPVGSVGGSVLPAQLVVERGRTYWPAVCYARPGLLAVKVDTELGDADAHAFGRAFARSLRLHKARSLLVVDAIPGAPVDVSELLDAGLPDASPGPVVAASADVGLRSRMDDAGLEPLEDGVFGGGAAAALLWAEAAGVPAALVAVQARPNLPDVRAAAALVTALSSLLDLHLDAGDLRERGDELERAWFRILEGAHPAAGGPRDAMFS